MERIDMRDLNDNVFETIGKEWMLVTAGNEEKFNMMTASWGCLGWLWNKPVAVVFIRECGIPTRGRSWMQFKAGYYLFAILFLMFDVEAVFLFPWAVTVQDAGIDGLINILFFMVILILGLAYAWRKGALEWK